MFGKLFGPKKVPQNEGNSGDSGPGKLRIVKLFELELTNMEGSPAYSLTHQLTIGSEIGNVIIADPSVSPRHATFVLQQEVVSLTDHGSVAGTLVNGKKITSGRTIILEETDVIHVGDLEIRIRTTNESVPFEEIPEPPAEIPNLDFNLDNISEPGPGPVVEKKKLETAVIEQNVMDSITKAQEIELVQKVEPVKIKAKPLKAVKKDHAKLNIGFVSASNSANSLVRVIAVILDSLLAYSVVVILWPFDEFRSFLDIVPTEIAHLLGFDWSALWLLATDGLPFVREFSSDIYKFLSGFLQILPLFFTFILLRLSTTLLFGVSISESLLGIKPSGNKIWARIGGVIRVIIGIFTAPLVIFDLPAIASRRTFKEFVTYTNIQLKSKLMAMLSSIVLIPAFIALALISPIFQGLELPESIPVNDRIDKRVKAKLAPAPAAGETASVEAVNISKFLNMELTYNPLELSLIPLIKFQGTENKIKYSPQMVFYHPELQRAVTLELLKTFDFQQLLGLGIRGNFFLYDSYPEIHSFVYRPEGSIPFKTASNALTQINFANEVMRFTKMALDLSLSTSMEIMQTETPLLKGLVEFRSSFLTLLEYKDFEEIGFVKLGNVIFMKITYHKQKPFDLIIPLIKGQGRIFKVEFDKKENLQALASKFYKYSLNKTNWLDVLHSETSETLNALQVVDLLSFQDVMIKDIPADKAQGLYAYYFEKSAEVIKKADANEYGLWKKSLASVTSIIDSLQKTITQDPPDPENPINKLQQNFKDLNDAVEIKNLEYFGVTDTQTI